MLQEKQFYLNCLADGPLTQRKIANRMSTKFDTSPAAVKDALLAEGLIVLSHSKREGAMQKFNHYYKLTNKKLKPVEQKQDVVADTWDDGTPKSKGNAFDLSSAKGLFSKSEMAAMVNKGKPNNYNIPVQVITYSRA